MVIVSVHVSFATQQPYNPYFPHLFFTRSSTATFFANSSLGRGNGSVRLGFYEGVPHLRHPEELWLCGSVLLTGEGVQW